MGLPERMPRWAEALHLAEQFGGTTPDYWLDMEDWEYSRYVRYWHGVSKARAEKMKK